MVLQLGEPQMMDQAIQSPSNSMVYGRLCKSLKSGIIAEQRSILVGNSRSVKQFRRRERCSSTATTIDQYADMDENDMDELILQATSSFGAYKPE